MDVPGMWRDPRQRRECSGEHFGGRTCRDSAWRRYKSRPLHGAESQLSEKCEPTGRLIGAAGITALQGGEDVNAMQTTESPTWLGESLPFRAGRMSTLLAWPTILLRAKLLDLF